MAVSGPWAIAIQTWDSASEMSPSPERRETNVGAQRHPRLSRRSGNPEPFTSIAWVRIRKTPRLSSKQAGPTWTTPPFPHVFECGKGLWIPAAARKTGRGYAKIGVVNAIVLSVPHPAGEPPVSCKVVGGRAGDGYQATGSWLTPYFCSSW